MTLPRTVADVLTEHTVFEVECIDRMYLNAYVPKLQYAGGLIGYLRDQLGQPVCSTAPLGKVSDAFTASIRRFAAERGIPWVDFAKGQRKDDIAHQFLESLTVTRGCCSSAGPRSGPRSSAPRSAGMPRARVTRGS